MIFLVNSCDDSEMNLTTSEASDCLRRTKKKQLSLRVVENSLIDDCFREMKIKQYCTARGLITPQT